MDEKRKHLLWSGVGNLRGNNMNAALDCRVYQTTFGKHDVVFEWEDLSGQLPPIISEADLKLEIPGIREPLGVIVGQNSWNSEGNSSVTLLPLQSPWWFSKSRPLRSGRFVLVNFDHYWMGSPNDLDFTLKGSGWATEFLAITEKSCDSLSVEGDEFRITHQATFAREDGSSFTDQEAKDFLSKLALFLSFCHGQWVGLSRVVGLDDNGEIALEQWGTGRVSSCHVPSGWLDGHHGSCILQLYEEFFQKLSYEGWLDAINHVVYWFARAYTNTVGPDGACILLQAALERLAWHVLVRERGAIRKRLSRSHCSGSVAADVKRTFDSNNDSCRVA